MVYDWQNRLSHPRGSRKGVGGNEEMNYSELINLLSVGIANDKVKNTVETMQNELCLKCGKYKEAHNGACEGCRWKI